MRRGAAKWCPSFWAKKYKTLVSGRQKVIILTSYTLEEILQSPYSHYIDPVSDYFTKNFRKSPLLVVLLTHLLAEMARHVIHGIVGCLATCVAKVPERWKHSIKQHRCYNKYITIFELWSMFLFQVIRLVALLIGWPTYIQKNFSWITQIIWTNKHLSWI